MICETEKGESTTGRRTSKIEVRRTSQGKEDRKAEDNHSQAPVGVGIYLLLVPGLPLSLCPTTQGGGPGSCVSSSNIAGERFCPREESASFICVLDTMFCKDMLGANHQEKNRAIYPQLFSLGTAQ